MTFIAKSVQMSPGAFVEELTTIGATVQDYLATPGTPFFDRFQNLSIHNYLSGNMHMGPGNSAHFAMASKFWNALALPQISMPYANDTAFSKDAVASAKGKPIHIRNLTKQFDLVPKGQGYPNDFQTMLECAWFNKDIYIKDPALKPYLDVPKMRDFLAKVDADNIVGLDCIGFVHQYLYRAGVVDEYLGYSAKGYLTQFKPIGSLADIEPLCVCAWENDTHLVIIDKVHSINGAEAKIDICQSSGEVKKTSLLTVRSTGRQLVTKDPETKKEIPYSFWGSTVGSPTVFELVGGGIPVLPYVLIGKLPGLKLAAGGGATAPATQ